MEKSSVSTTIFYKGEKVSVNDLNEADMVSVWGRKFSVIGTAEDLELLAKDILEGIADIRTERAGCTS